MMQAGRCLEHDPAKYEAVPEKIMLKRKDRAG
jgi:hypothetical protein